MASRDVEALYRAPALLWPVCVGMLFWITRMWALAHRGAIEDEPVIAALKDRSSYFVGVLVVILMLAAA
jgi:hypothetical protein